MNRTPFAVLVALLSMSMSVAHSTPTSPHHADGTESAGHATAQDVIPTDAGAALLNATEAEVRFAIAHELWLLDVLDRAASSGETELQVAAAVLAASPALRAHDLGSDRLETLFRQAAAGAALRPDLLALLESACASIRDPLAAFDDAVERRLPTTCADVDFVTKLTSIEPANAYHWVRRAGDALSHGDAEAARTFLLATGRSTYWKPPYRDVLGVLLTMVSRWPPDAELEEAARTADAIALENHQDDAYAVAMMEAWHEPATLAALHAQGLALLAADFRALSPPLLPCREATASGDAPLLAVCRRLARLWVDTGDSVVDVRVGYRLLIDIETPAASALAERDLDDFQENHYSAYWRALREHNIAPDLLADVHNLIDHGEIEMMRRGLARVEARLAIAASENPPSFENSENPR